MNAPKRDIEKIKILPRIYSRLLGEIVSSLKEIINGKRRIMYSDIINIIIRKGYKGEDYNQLILWCNYKIRTGEIFIELE